MRAYGFQLEERFVRQDLDDGLKGVGRIESTLSRKQGHLGVVRLGVDNCWSAVAGGWVLEVDVPVEQLMSQGAGLVRVALDRMPEPLPWWSATSFTATLLMAGDRAALTRLADRVLDPDGLESGPSVLESELGTARRLVAIAVRRDEQARSQPSAPGDDRWEVLLEAMMLAVLDGRQDDLDTAARERHDLRQGQARRSVRHRRSWAYLLDRLGIAVMLCAQDRGLTPTPGLADIPLEVLARRQG